MIAHSLTIRPARIEDAANLHAALMAIANHVGQPEHVTSSQADLERYGFGADPAFHALIAEVGEAFAGAAIFFPIFSTWRGRPGVYVQDFYVADEFRGQGVGERLLQRLAAVTRERGGRYIRLAVDTQNHRAQAFYARAGIKHSDTEQIHAAYDADFEALANADAEGQR